MSLRQAGDGNFRTCNLYPSPLEGYISRQQSTSTPGKIFEKLVTGYTGLTPCRHGYITCLHLRSSCKHTPNWIWG